MGNDCTTQARLRLLQIRRSSSEAEDTMHSVIRIGNNKYIREFSPLDALVIVRGSCDYLCLVQT